MLVTELSRTRMVRVNRKIPQPGDIVLRWAVNRKRSPRLARIGIEASRDGWAIVPIVPIDRDGGPPALPAPVFRILERTIYPGYAIRLAINPDWQENGHAVWFNLRWCFNHHAADGGAMIGIECPPGLFIITAEMRDEKAVPQ